MTETPENKGPKLTELLRRRHASMQALAARMKAVGGLFDNDPLLLSEGDGEADHLSQRLHDTNRELAELGATEDVIKLVDQYFDLTARWVARNRLAVESGAHDRDGNVGNMGAADADYDLAHIDRQREQVERALRGHGVEAEHLLTLPKCECDVITQTVFWVFGKPACPRHGTDYYIDPGID